MSQEVTCHPPLRLTANEDWLEAIAWQMENLPLGFSSTHCAQARVMLKWSVDTLAYHSGVTPGAIRRFEEGAELRLVTRQALAFALEAEGLIFFPGHEPMRGENCRGATKNPCDRDDFHLIE
jgi:hypothetical protein